MIRSPPTLALPLSFVYSPSWIEVWGAELSVGLDLGLLQSVGQGVETVMVLVDLILTVGMEIAPGTLQRRALGC